MRQTEFEYLIAQDMQLPRKIISSLVKEMTYYLENRMESGDAPSLPRFGKWYVAVRQGKNIYNPYYEEIRHYNARLVVKFTQFLWSGKSVSTTWKTYLPATGVRVYPQSDIADAIALRSGIDVLICNQFIYVIVDLLIQLLEADDYVSLNNFGTFKLYGNKSTVRRNIKYGYTYFVPARNKVSFKAANQLKRNIG